MEKFLKREEVANLVEMAMDYADANPDKRLYLSISLGKDSKSIDASVWNHDPFEQLNNKSFTITECECTADDALAYVTGQLKEE